jgi:hypothetical protein
MNRFGVRLCLLIAALLLAISCSRSGPTSKLIVRWTPSTNAIVATALTPAPTGAVSVVSTPRGPAWSFDGKRAAILVTDSTALHFGSSQNFSITALIQPQANNNSFGVSSIVEKRQVSGIAAALGFSLHLEYGLLACQLAPTPPTHWHFVDFTSPKRFRAAWQGRKAPGPVYRFISTTPSLTDGKFHHVALTLDRRSASGGKLYVDGMVVKKFDPTKIPGNLSNAQSLIIGNHPDSTLQCAFKGLIQQVSIYRRAISAEEVARESQGP